MRSVTIPVEEPVYRDFQRLARRAKRSTSELIREAMENYRPRSGKSKPPLWLAWLWMEEFRLDRKRILDTILAATYHEAGIRKPAAANAGNFALFKVFDFEPWAMAPQ